MNTSQKLKKKEGSPRSLILKLSLLLRKPRLAVLVKSLDIFSPLLRGSANPKMIVSSISTIAFNSSRDP
jgi:hypothetical protein